MNRIDAFFVCASIFLAWVFFVSIAPKFLFWVVMWFIACISVGLYIGRLYRKLVYGSEDSDLMIMIKINKSLLRINEDILWIVDDQQAQIDVLMLKYCPEEMTQKQKEEWKASQRTEN